MQNLRAKAKTTPIFEATEAPSPALDHPEADQVPDAGHRPTGLRAGEAQAALTSRAFGAAEIKDALGIDLPRIEHRLDKGEQQWRTEGEGPEWYSVREPWDDESEPGAETANTISAYIHKQTLHEQEAMRERIVAAGYTIHQTETGGWYALLPGEKEFIHDGDKMNYLGFFSTEKDLLEEVSETLQDAPKSASATTARAEIGNLTSKVQFRNTVYFMEADDQRVRLTIKRNGEADSNSPLWSGRAAVLSKAIVDDAWGEFCDELEDKYGHSDHEHQYEQTFERGKTIRNAMLERAAQNGDLADLMKQLEKIL